MNEKLTKGGDSAMRGKCRNPKSCGLAGAPAYAQGYGGAGYPSVGSTESRRTTDCRAAYGFFTSVVSGGLVVLFTIVVLRAEPMPTPTPTLTPSPSPTASASPSPAATATLTPSEYGSQAYEREMKTPPPESPSPSPSVTPQE